MAVKIISATDTIEVNQLCVVIFGQPGSKKTSLAQTADNPITYAFDPGVYRAFGRKTSAAFDTWEDVVSFDSSKFRTPVIDTVGQCLSKLGQAVVAENAKHGNRTGGLTLQGYGALKERFKGWVESRKQSGQDLVFIAQEKEDRNGDESYFRPDIVGGSYNTLMEVCDLIGYLHFENGRKVIDFNPTDRWMAKAPPCGWQQMVLPDFAAKPTFLADLIAEAKASMGRISGESAAMASVIDGWKVKLAADPTLPEFNGLLPEYEALANGVKKQVKALLEAHARQVGWKMDAKAKAFVVKEVPA